MSTFLNEIDELSPDTSISNPPVNSAPPIERNQRGRFFSSPRLPRSLIIVALLLILTNICVSLINQPAIYWLDNNTAVSTAPVIGAMMIKGPVLFAAVSAAYLILIWLLLAFLPRYPALILWMVLCFLHLRDTIQWSRCGLNRIYYDPGNSMTCGIVDFLLAIIGAGILGIVLANNWFSREASASVANQTMPQSRRKLSPVAVTATIAWIAFLTVGLVRATATPDSGWLPIQANNAPPPRIDGKIVFDSDRGKAILFGGATAYIGDNEWLTENDTWEWNGNNWTLIVPPLSPPARISHALAYDETRGVTILFGGKNHSGPLNDTWQWDGRTWTQLFSPVSPPARCCHHMYYDNDSGKVKVYGGYDGVSFFNDIWEWDGQQWSQVVFETSNPIASGFGLAYDDERGQLVTFLAGFPAGTWILQDDHWSNPQFDLAPPERSNLAFAYNETSGQAVLFGGTEQEKLLNDTWLFDEEWQEIDSDFLPKARWGHALFYDENRERMILFGGFDGQTYLNDMWELAIPES